MSAEANISVISLKCVHDLSYGSLLDLLLMIN